MSNITEHLLLYDLVVKLFQKLNYAMLKKI